MKRLLRLFRSSHFIYGVFAGFVGTMLAFTFVLTQLYTPNNLLEHSGFYKDGKYYLMIERTSLSKCYRRNLE